ncbi:hypothetical protein L208DRAFT_1411362 [Tricholoma matsutake]|nr:hypothetical protein L208DRAFT_1411362 [Tricholoma matsutake 945]
MFIPFISKPRSLNKLLRRKGGGGGGGRGGGGGGAKGSSSSSGAGTKGVGGVGGVKSPVNTGGSTKSATSYGSGGGKSAPISAGQLFSGRQSGGGTRNQVFGSQQYGSGYPGITGRGVAGRGFPFIFWPLAWGGAIGLGTGAYLHNNEYGRPDNSSRPGGPMVTAEFVSNSTNATTFRLLADNTTVSDLITAIKTNCSSNLSSSSSSTPSTYNDSLTALPQPEQAIQYYRASSVALSLDGYNNTGALGPDGTPNTPLPSNIDTTLLDCLNQTIGAAVPLVDGSIRWTSSNMGLIGLFWVLRCLSSYL